MKSNTPLSLYVEEKYVPNLIFHHAQYSNFQSCSSLLDYEIVNTK